MWIWILTALWVSHTDLIKVGDYQLPEEAYLSSPVAMAFSPDGKLVLLDNTQFLLYVWDAKGTFQRSFGRSGEGPGEMGSPFQLHATNDAIYVWEDQQKISVFHWDGSFKTSFRTTGARPRSFGVLNPDLLLLGYRVHNDEGATMNFDLRNSSGEQLKTIYSEVNKGFLHRGEGDNNATIVAFMPEVEVQPSLNGTWLYGFSQTSTLYEIDAQGKTIAEHRFELPRMKPDQRDLDIYMNLSFPSPNGGRVSIKDLPNINIETSLDKAFYTHFILKDDKIAFVLSPLGSTDGVATGHAYGTYYVCDFESGKVISRGAYQFPEDSLMFYSNNRALGCVIDDSGDYSISEYQLKGL
jgi:hypothetical protein